MIGCLVVLLESTCKSLFILFSGQLSDQQTRHHESYHTLSHFFSVCIRVCTDVRAFLISKGVINNLIDQNL